MPSRGVERGSGDEMVGKLANTTVVRGSVGRNRPDFQQNRIVWRQYASRALVANPGCIYLVRNMVCAVRRMG